MECSARGGVVKRFLTGLGQLALLCLGIAIAIATAAAVLAVLDPMRDMPYVGRSA
jgi:hypothetical protein